MDENKLKYVKQKMNEIVFNANKLQERLDELIAQMSYLRNLIQQDEDEEELDVLLERQEQQWQQSINENRNQGGEDAD
jgi:predicted transcriptional regulator